jgi:hypothetical protein
MTDPGTGTGDVPVLAAARGQLTVTELADGVVYSRSGLTYQAGLLEKASSSAAPARRRPRQLHLNRHQDLSRDRGIDAR